MRGRARNPFCGPPGFGLKQILGIAGAQDISSWFENGHVSFVHKGRTAIRHACNLLGLSAEHEVLAPAYNCGSEIDALLHSGASVVLYPVDRSCQVNITDLEGRITSKTKAVFLIHYFGFPQSVIEIRKFCEKYGLYLIEDCALSLFSCDGMMKLGTVGDVSAFSLPKTLPVPDGGVFFVNRSDSTLRSWYLTPPSNAAVLMNVLPLLKSAILRLSSNVPLLFGFFLFILSRRHYSLARADCSEKDESKLPDMPKCYYYDEDVSDKAISFISKWMLKAFDVHEIRKRRRENFCRYLELLSGYSSIEPLFKELGDGICPLYFPVLVKNRLTVCQELNDQSIAAIAWWSGYHRGLPWEKFPDACFLKDNLLVLPVHQQLNLAEITFIAERTISAVR